MTRGMRRRSKMEIRKAQKGDIAAIAELEKLCFASPWSERAIEETMSGERAVFLVATEDDKVAGYIGSYCCYPEGYITNVAVDPGFRRRGIGRALVAELIKIGRKEEFSFLTLEVRVSNEAAISLYKLLGFSDVGLRPRFYSAPVEDARLMTYYFDAPEKN